MRRFNVTLESITPYMQHRMDSQKLEEWEKNRKNIIERADVALEDQVRAEYHAYRNAKGEYYLPSEHIRQCLIGGGSFLKSKVGASRKSMTGIVAAMFMVTPDEIILPPFDEIDKRSAQNKNVKARIIVIRPKWNHWKVTFVLEVWDDSITVETIKEIITNSGNYVGIGSYRPTNKGLFGRFSLVGFEEIK